MSVNPLTSMVIYDQEGDAWLEKELVQCPFLIYGARQLLSRLKMNFAKGPSDLSAE